VVRARRRPAAADAQPDIGVRMLALLVGSDGALGSGKLARTHHTNAERSSGDNFLTASIATASSALVPCGLGSSAETVADGCAGGNGASLQSVA